MTRTNSYDGLQRHAGIQVINDSGQTLMDYSPTKDELLDSVEYAHEYDTNGSLIAEYHPDGSLYRTFEYNAETRLSVVRDHNDELIAEYRYDPFGRRVSKTVYDPAGENPETTWYIYSDQGLMAELDGQGNQTDFYLFPPDGLWSTDPILRKSEGIHFYYQTDHLGTPQQLIDSAGAVVHSREMRAFGEVAASGIEDRWRFPGQLESAETGLYYNYFRDYEPGTGRYRQSDPIGVSGGINLHSYSWQNPMVFFDEQGLSPLKWWAICEGVNQVDAKANSWKRYRRRRCQEEFQEAEMVREDTCRERMKIHCIDGGQSSYFRASDATTPRCPSECIRSENEFCDRWSEANKMDRQACMESVGDDWWLPSLDCGVPPIGGRRK